MREAKQRRARGARPRDRHHRRWWTPPGYHCARGLERRLPAAAADIVTRLPHRRHAPTSRFSPRSARGSSSNRGTSRCRCRPGRCAGPGLVPGHADRRRPGRTAPSPWPARTGRAPGGRLGPARDRARERVAHAAAPRGCWITPRGSRTSPRRCTCAITSSASSRSPPTPTTPPSGRRAARSWWSAPVTPGPRSPRRRFC